MPESNSSGRPNDVVHVPDRDHGRGFDGWWEERTLPTKVLAVIGFAILGIGLTALFGFVVMVLWNWLMPDIFGVKRVDYWQGWGLLILCWILFKNWGLGGSSGSNDRKRREQLRRYVHEDLGPAEDPPASREA
jgi:hypothetical protein